MDWYNAVDTYIELVEQQSFVKTAERLGLTTSACSKRINWLEQQLGCQLLIRSTRRIRVTERGEHFYKHSKQWLQQFRQLKDSLNDQSQGLKGLLTIGATSVTTKLILVPALRGFLEQHPQVQVKLLDVEPNDAPDLSVDLTVIKELEDWQSASFKAARLFDYSVRLYASPEFIQRHGPIEDVNQLQQLPILLAKGQLDNGGVMLSDGTLLNQQPQVVCESPAGIIEAAIQGMGIILISEEAIQRDLQQARLQAIMPQLRSETRALMAYYPNHHLENPLVKNFLLALRQHCDGMFKPI
ncbi:LysR family transcriptional regulator [Aliagarivorans taiwanensis]|uniref:LysR family transcriptional regulator n=1 Tax=Aliagarivorans taiwanensis TaxID=561966 RepID=UPI00040733B9|nr:LysR family transcriptional regulator [Aliagarivorans taiwanensis]